MIKKILLVMPPGTVFVQPDGTTQTKECIPSLGLAYMAAQIKNTGKYDIKIYDMVVEDFNNTNRISRDTIIYGDSFDNYKKVLSEYKPDLVGIQCMLSSRSRSSIHLCEITKEFNSEIITVMGGHHASALPYHVLGCDSVDFVLFGEADYSFLDLVDTLSSGKNVSAIDGLAYKDNGKIIIHPQTKYIKKIDALPYPAWDIANIQKYWRGYLPMGIPLRSSRYAIMNTSRGCPHICNYCAVPNHTGERNYRAKALDDVAKELDWLVSKYGIEEVQFQDDNFFVNKKRTKELCKIFISDFPKLHFAVPTGTDLPNLDFELIDLLKKANFHDLMLGVETGDINTQNKFVDKKIDLNNIKEKVEYIKKIGLNPAGLFLMGFPDETHEQLKNTLDLIIALDLDKIHLIMLTPIPGSNLYDNCIKNDLLYDDFDVEKLRYTNSFVKNKNISRREIEDIRVNFWRGYMAKKQQ
ncbi:MAG: radical SAM protein [Candidatus Omnitrophica bacterium]|nr:radical SAM protein [Candidatus Omnitrophota bacterium]